MLTIDGSQGEGGGQILRSSLALSLVTGKPFRLQNIRARRPRPGLMRQHLTCVEAAAAVGSARVEGAAIGAGTLTFYPGQVRPGNYSFSMGTAGSTILVLQTILPALVTATAASTIAVEGGTHNPGSPPFEFLDRAYLPLLARMGPQVEATLIRAGFYPAGGGKITATVVPVPKLAGIVLHERGKLVSQSGRAVVANLPRTIAAREVARLAQRLGWDASEFGIEQRNECPGPGNVVLVHVQSEHVTEVFTGFGERGVPAEEVAERAANEVLEYLGTDVPVGPHLADQLLLLLALAGAGSFRSCTPTPHTLTHLSVIERFLGPVVAAQQESPHAWRFSASSRVV